MPITYGTNIFNTKSLPELLKQNKTDNLRLLKSIVRFFAQIVVQISITAIARAIDAFAPGLGILAEAGLTFGTDLFFDYLENGEIIKEDIGFSAGFAFLPIGFKLLKRSLPFIKKGLKFISSKHKNVFYGIASEIQDRTLAKQIKKIGKNTFKIGINNKLNKVSQVFNKGQKIGNRAYFKAEQQLKFINEKLVQNQFKNTLGGKLKQIQNFRNQINQTKKYLFISRQITSAATSPRYLAKKTADLLSHKYKRKINKYLGNIINKKAQSIKKNLSSKLKKFGYLVEETPKYIPLKSNVVNGIRLITNNDRWDFATISAIVYFNKQSTFSNKSGSKKPIFLSNKNTNKVLEFLTTRSPMAHYLDNFSYGWKIGKWLKQNQEFLFMSKIPIFSDFVNHLFWTYKTIEGIVNSLNQKEWEWKKDNALSEFRTGILDNSLKGWKLPYVSPIIHGTRGLAVKNDRYITTTIFKQTNKQLKNYQIKKSINKMKRRT